MTGQDWLEKDFYATLGVSKDADDKEIKTAYRKLARKFHPDQNQGDAKAEAKFKEIGEAYAVLSDKEQRQQYDAIRQMGSGGRFTGGSAGGFEDLFGGGFGGGRGGGGFEDILGQMFGGGFGGFPGGSQQGFGTGFQPNRAQAGADLTASTTLSFDDAVNGSEISLNVEGRTIKARIPAGIKDGQKIRLAGKGRPGSGGGPAGNLVLTVSVKPHPVFTMDGNNLRMNLPVSFDEAALGAQVEVPTYSGDTVKVKIAAGTPHGKVLRLKGRGVVTTKGTGDLLVTVNIVVPQNLNKAAKKAIEDFRDAVGDADVRADLKAALKE